MPDEETFRDKKTSVPVACQHCDRTFWHETEKWPPPVLCGACRAQASGTAFDRAMKELFNA